MSPFLKLPGIMGQSYEAIGYRALVDRYNLSVMQHFRWSYLIDKGSRRALTDRFPAIYLYGQSYACDDPQDPLQQLAFALKHEGLNLEIITALFGHLSAASVQAYVEQQSSGKYQRIVWYLYEQLTGCTLALPDLKQGSYIDVLDASLYYTCQPNPQPRYRLNDNLLGELTSFCPFVRRTSLLSTIADEHLDRVARGMADAYGQSVLERASTFLYTQETLSSYQIEREKPDKRRLISFIHLVKKVENIKTLDEELLTALQNSIVEERFADTGYRTIQNYIGQKRDLDYEIIHYISPKPEDVVPLMQGLLASLQRMIASNVDPMVIAAAIAFGFVYIHPFDDGNGRLHRFLIHYILRQTNFAPQGVMFPISAVILSDMRRYNDVLEQVSNPLMALVTDYTLNEAGQLTVHQATKTLYQYIDYTVYAEYLAACIKKTIYTDFKKELEYLTCYDQAKQELQEIVAMPDRLIDLFIRVTVPHQGVLSENKRTSYFSMLTPEEVIRMEEVVRRVFADAFC